MFPILDYDQLNPIGSGINRAFDRQKLSDEHQRMQLMNQLSQIQNQYAPQNQQAELTLKQAQAKRENALAELPFGGQQVSGPAGQIIGLEMIGRQFGYDSPQYKQAKQMFDLDRESDISRINYQNTLAKTAPIRMLTPSGKETVEQANVRLGLSPGGREWKEEVGGGNPPPGFKLTNEKPNIPDNQRLPLPPGTQEEIDKKLKDQYAPGTAEELSENYKLIRMKRGGDASTRERNLFASNIDKTLNTINVDSLTRYSGPQGTLEWVHEKAKDLAGHPSSEYLEYQKNVTSATGLATQIRQFYKDSIQPSVRQELQEMSNPSSWHVSPQVAKAKFERLKQILEMETGTYREAGKTSKAYEKQENPSNSSKNIIVSDGKQSGSIPSDRVEEFLKAHPTFRRTI